ncbi:hypothetical protein [Candidatus Electronema sp. PJ]|uniref:hypothetical protein n=1 Tax=Candidatus Electronema sp. PJ TaxID=3401572 RepID=UPI003AA86AFF
MKRSILVAVVLGFVFISSIAYAQCSLCKPAPGDLDPLSANIGAVTNMANMLSNKPVNATQDDTGRCYKAGIHVGTKGEWRQLNGSVKAVYLVKDSIQSNSTTTVAVFRIAVTGKSKQKGYICVRDEHHTRDEDFTGDAYIKLKHSNNQTALIGVDVQHDHWGMMREAIITSANQLGFIVML